MRSSDGIGLGPATPRPRVLVIGARGIPDMEGGAEKNAQALFPRLARRGYAVTVMGLSAHMHGTSHMGVRLLSVPSLRLLKTDKLLYYCVAILHAARSRAEIVHLQGLGAALFLWAYKLMGKKVVVRYGSADYLVPKWGLVGRLGFRFCEWQLRHADAVISVTPSLSRRLAQRGICGNVRLISNAVDDPCRAAPPVRARPYILAVGRVTGQKNVAMLLRAFAIFSRAHPDFDLLVAGGLDDRAYVASLAGLRSDRTLFLGRLPRGEIAGLLAGATLVVNISLHEGRSNATLEAISQPRPLVISDIAENRDMGLPEHVYVDPLDPEAIAARLGAAIAAPARFTLDRRDFPTWEQVADETAALYRAVLGHPARTE